MSDSGSIEETIFIGARHLSGPEERAAYLDNACGDDRALRERIERMLNAEQKADQFLANNPLQVDQTALVTIKGGEAVGSMIGRYKLLQQIGEGGCGIVYMAEQEQPIRRRVALKVIKPGMDTRQVIARFEAERQALAMMDHPNIARVLDAGATEAGRPYFVMELVRGIRITQYCDQNNLATRERLELFTKVVQAVQHAHQKGIIHRDLKPSNVLITLHDGVPVPKVIDFGIAKALEQKLTDKTLFTQFEQFIGTPAYTSPEQAEMSGLDIDTRSDIYSLGVLLYELLVGKTPFDAQDLVHSGLDEMRRMIREQEPARPSTRLSTMLQGEVTTTAQHRRVSAPELVHLLKGDLDWIVMKCLEKDRTRRYDTANGLGNDIEHYLGNEPVTARPPSRAYRFGKLVRRNKLAFAASTAVVMALVLGIIVSTWQAARARQAEKAAQAEKDSAEAVLKFFRDKVLAAGRPEGHRGGLGKDATLRQAIDAAGSEITKAFQDRPLVEAAIRKTLGESYQYLGEPARAVEQLERALALRRQASGLEHKDTIAAMMLLARMYGGAGKLDQARRLSDEAIKLTRAMPPLTRWSMEDLLLAYQTTGKIDEGLTILEETLKLSKTRLGSDDGRTLTIMFNLAGAYRQAGKREQAVSLLEELVKLEGAKSGPEDDYTIEAVASLAMTYSEMGRFSEGIPLLEEALRLFKAKRGPENYYTLQFMWKLALAYRSAGRHDQALQLFEETVTLSKATLGPEHPDTLLTMNDLAEMYAAAGKHEQAVPLYEEILKLRKAKLGPLHHNTIWSMGKLAGGYADAGKLDQALPLHEETIRLLQDKLGPDHPGTLAMMNELAVTYYQAGKREQARPLYEQVFTLRKAKLGPEHLDTINAMHDVAVVHWESGRIEQALPLLEEATNLRKTKLGTEHPQTLWGMNRLARAYKDAGKLDRALALFEETLRLRRANLGPEHRDTQETIYDLAELRYRQRQYAEAEPLYREIVQSRRGRLAADHKDVIDSMASLARLLADWAWAERDSKSDVRNPKSEIAGRAREAERLLRECLAVRLSGTNATHWRVHEGKSRLGGALVSVAVTDPALNATTREAKLAEAETLLLEGHQRLQESQSADKKYKRDALERLVRLYEAWGKPDQLSEWQQQLEDSDRTKPESSPPAAQASQ